MPHVQLKSKQLQEAIQRKEVKKFDDQMPKQELTINKKYNSNILTNQTSETHDRQTQPTASNSSAIRGSSKISVL